MCGLVLVSCESLPHFCRYIFIGQHGSEGVTKGVETFTESCSSCIARCFDGLLFDFSLLHDASELTGKPCPPVDLSGDESREYWGLSDALGLF